MIVNMEKPRVPKAERKVTDEAENPYRRIFLAIEAAAQAEDLSPQAAYEIYEEFLLQEGLDPTIYLSMAITSGGYARDADLDIGQVITNNTDFGTLAKEALLRQHPELNEADIILPSDLGKVRGWSQSDYLLFWFHVIVGLEAEDAAKVSERMTDSLEYPGFTDKTLPPEQRWSDYARFTRDYVRDLHGLKEEHGRDLQPNNMQAMIMILDGDMSLGGRAEAELCRAIGIPPQQQMLDALVVSDTPELQMATTELRALGAHALGLSLNPPGMQFVGWSAGPTNPNLAFGLGFRKTGLANAVFAADYYEKRPMARPPRHEGHQPLAQV
jgi:hypothetical protein